MMKHITHILALLSLVLSSTVSMAQATQPPLYDASDFVVKYDFSNLPFLTTSQITFNLQGTISVATPATIEYYFNGNMISQTIINNGEFTLASDFNKGTIVYVVISGLSINQVSFYDQNGSGSLSDVINWGDIQWTSMSQMFEDCDTLDVVATDLPDLSMCTSLASMFEDCDRLNGPSNINMWDLSNITDINSMFESCDIFNQNIGNWDVSNVTNFEEVFDAASTFNQDISNWDVRNGENFYDIFYQATSFNQNLGAWKLNNAEDIDYFFDENGFTCENVSATLVGWAANPDLANNLDLDDNDNTYSPNIQSSIDILISKGWVINNDGNGLFPASTNCYSPNKKSNRSKSTVRISVKQR